MTVTIDLGIIAVWLVLTLLMVWAIGSFCVSHGRYMELKAREELANKRNSKGQS